jgi:hypothetical protein
VGKSRRFGKANTSEVLAGALKDRLRPVVVLPCLVTPDLVGGSFAQRWKNGFRIESGMTKV